MSDYSELPDDGYEIPASLYAAAERRLRVAQAAGSSEMSIAIKMIDTVVEHLKLREERSPDGERTRFVSDWLP